jgi:hypothetical protein
MKRVVRLIGGGQDYPSNPQRGLLFPFAVSIARVVQRRAAMQNDWR